MHLAFMTLGGEFRFNKVKIIKISMKFKVNPYSDTLLNKNFPNIVEIFFFELQSSFYCKTAVQNNLELEYNW